MARTTLAGTPTAPEALRAGDAQIIAMPYSSNIELSGGALRPSLSVLSRISINAASVLWKSQQPGRACKLIIPGETCFGPELPNTTDLMRSHAISLGVPADAIVGLSPLPDGRGLNNTYLQMQALAAYANRNPVE